MRVVVEVIKYIWIPFIVALAAYLAFVEKDVRLSLVVLFSLTAIYVLSFLYWRERTKVRQWAEEPRIPARERVDADDYVRELMLKADEDIIDECNRYKLLRFRALIDKTGTYSGYYSRIGVNVSDHHVNELVVKTATDCNVPFEEMQMRAFDLRHNRELHLNCFVDERFMKKCRILFPEPVSPGGEFEVEWQFTWPYVMRKWGDFDGIDISRFKCGIERVEIELVFDWELRSFTLLEVKDADEEQASIQPTHSIDEEQRHMYRWSCDNPTADAYVFSYF